MAGDEWDYELKKAVFEGQEREFQDLLGEQAAAPRLLLLRRIYARCVERAARVNENGEGEGP